MPDQYSIRMWYRMLGDLDYKLCETALMELFATHTYRRRYLRYGRNVQNIQFHTSKTRERPGEKCRKPLASMDITGRKKHWKA